MENYEDQTPKRKAEDDLQNPTKYHKISNNLFDELKNVYSSKFNNLENLRSENLLLEESLQQKMENLQKEIDDVQYTRHEIELLQKYMGTMLEKTSQYQATFEAETLKHYEES